MKSRLLLIMIDGVSADYFSAHARFMPNTRKLAKSGTVFARLPPERCGSSLPGRTAILTGLTSREHGIYGNVIWDSNSRSFRYSTPYDVRNDTLFTHARRTGLDTASIGYGMVRPEDCSIYLAPYWVGDFVGRSRDQTPVPLSPGWKRALEPVDDGRMEQADARLGFAPATGMIELGANDLDDMAQDLMMIQRVNQLIASDHPPDLVFTEINVTDSVQHTMGYGSSHAHVAIAWADTLVGMVIENLEQCGQRQHYTVVVTSDHGHGNTKSAIYADRIITDTQWSSECAVLFLETGPAIDRTVDALACHGARVLDNAFLPAGTDNDLVTLALDDARSFEPAPASANGDTGPSHYKSSHSYWPGTRSDDRFAVISGPCIPQNLIGNGSAEQVYLLLANVLGLEI